MSHAQLEKLRIGFLADPLATLLYLADATGSFSRNGLEVSFHHYDGGAYAIQDVVAGTIDLAAATEYALVHQSFRQRDLRSFATISTANNTELLVRSDRGIEGPRDLRGRRIGVTAGMNIHYILGTFLAFNGLRFEDVESVTLTPSADRRRAAGGDDRRGLHLSPLHGPGEIGARHRHPRLARAGPRRTTTSSWSPASGSPVEKPRVVASVLRALLEAETYLRKHPAESRQIVGRSLGLSAEEVADRWAGIGVRVSLDEDLLTLMEDEARWIVSHGLADAEDLPNCYELLHFEPLERLKPEAVSVIH